MTHPQTHPAKRRDGNSGRKAPKQQPLPDTRAQKSTLSGASDLPTAVGKDEVGSSNLPSSSRKARFSEENRAFLYFSAHLSGSKKARPTRRPTREQEGTVPTGQKSSFGGIRGAPGAQQYGLLSHISSAPWGKASTKPLAFDYTRSPPELQSCFSAAEGTGVFRRGRSGFFFFTSYSSPPPPAPGW